MKECQEMVEDLMVLSRSEFVSPVPSEVPAGSHAPSVVESAAASVSGLKGQIKALYNPEEEDLSSYLLRMGRVVTALQVLDAGCDQNTLELITRKAEILIELHGEVGVADRKKAVHFLREKFTAYALDESMGPKEKDLSIGALGEIIQQLGGYPSASPEKVFSTPSDSKGNGLSKENLAKLTRDNGLQDSDDPSVMKAKLAAMEMELEALKAGKGANAMSDAGGSADSGQGGLVAALEEQTKVLKDAFAGRGSSSVTAVKTDLHWPTLGDDRSDFRDVSHFYEEFEDVCGLANSCRGMGHREMLLALRARCRGSRLKTYQNLYRAAWKSGEVVSDPEAVYERIKNKHLMFSESREEREIRIDSEHASLMKGKLTGHQFEPLFEHSVAELESVGLGKTVRELFLSYLRKVGPTLQKEIRSDKRLWGKEAGLRGPQTWEEAHRVVLEYEQREATNRATANAVYSLQDSDVGKPEQPKKPRKNAKGSGGTDTNIGVTAGDPRKEKLCWNFRDHGSCSKGNDCPFSHDKEFRKRELQRLKQQGKGGESTAAYQQGSLPAKGTPKGGKNQKGTGKGKADPKKKPAKDEKGPDKSQKQCPFCAKKGACKKGDNCDMSHTLITAPAASGSGMPSGWGAPSGAAMTNPFAAFSVVVEGPKEAAGIAGKVYATEPRPKGGQGSHPFTELDQLPADWWKVVQNERGGYQYKTITKVLGTPVETMLDGCAGSNHVTEELVVSILNKAASLGLKPEDKGFPIIQFEKWIYQEFVHGIASGSPVPLRGAVVLRVRLQEGTDPLKCTDGPEIFLRCKIASRGTSDWHGLIIGGRALDCEARRGLGFRPGPNAHIFDSLGVHMPRCEDLSAERKDRAYAFESVISSVDSGLAGSSEPGIASDLGGLSSVLMETRKLSWSQEKGRSFLLKPKPDHRNCRSPRLRSQSKGRWKRSQECGRPEAEKECCWSQPAMSHACWKRELLLES